MKVNQNISAVISNAQLLRTEGNLTASIERLSSGYKINAAKDNPSGMAISNKMRAQIKALDQSSVNATDGESVIQTADGALNEVHAILQRMRELGVQAATDSVTTEDRKAIQQEITELQAEVDRIAKDTEFNTKSLLDGSQDRRVYANKAGIENFSTSDNVNPGQYEFDITQVPTRAEALGVNIPAGTRLEINGVSADIPATATQAEIDAIVRDTADVAGVEIDGSTGTSYDLKSMYYGSSKRIELKIYDSNDTLITDINEKGKDTEIKIKGSESGFATNSAGNTTASYQASGRDVTITDASGFEIRFRVDPEKMTKEFGNTVGGTTLVDYEKFTGTIPVELEITDMGRMDLQVGAHEGQNIGVKIPSVTCEALYLDELNYVRKGGADEAIAKLDKSIAQLSEVRSRLGAYQNRLEYATASLDETSEDMESAISRVLDTDMAEEMASYSNLNVLNQAAISVLSQANDMPQQILQLLN